MAKTGNESEGKILSPYTQYINPQKFWQPDLSRILIFDTTLRDGEQSPGAALSPEEKEHLAPFIYAIGVDAMEVSFAISDPNEITATHKVIQALSQHENDNPERDVVIYSLSRAVPADVHAAFEAVKPARLPGIHTFVSTSDEHRVAKFPNKSWKDIKEMLAESSANAAEKLSGLGKYGMVEVSAEDALRTPIEKLIEIYSEVMLTIKPYFGRIGFTFNIPDTVGVVVNPKKYAGYIRSLKQHVDGIENVILSAHIHNDHGLAVASSLLSIEEGVRQIEVTVNGMGERAGNTSLEQIAMALAHDKENSYGVRTGINTRKLYPASIEISGFTGFHPGRNQPVVGSNARAHEAGIHQHGQLKGAEIGNPNTYEGVAADEIGAEGSRFPLGRRSGIHAVEYHLILMGYPLTRDADGKWQPKESKFVYDKFIDYAKDQRTVTHSNLKALMDSLGFKSNIKFPLEYIDHSRFTTSDIEMPEGAVVKLRINEGPVEEYVGHGKGEVEAVASAMRKAVGNSTVLKDYRQGNRNTLTARGVQSYARTEIILQDNEERFIFGEGYHLDIGKSAARAFANAWNTELLMRMQETNNKH